MPVSTFHQYKTQATVKTLVKEREAAADIRRKAVVLLSGGLDSTTCLAWALDQHYACHALSVAYGQRHQVELDAARAVADAMGVEDHRVVTLNLGDIARSSLTDRTREVPKGRSLTDIGRAGDLPSTYVPARNLVLLSLALSFAESIGARTLVLGANVLDYSGYPDCRPSFVRAFEQAANLATREGGFQVLTPLMDLTKAQIIRLGVSLGVDFGMTFSCYDPTPEGLACGRCDTCRLRARGFTEAGVPDPTAYATPPLP